MAEAVKKMSQTDWNRLKPTVLWDGKQLTLPNDPQKMPLEVAETILHQMRVEEEQVVQVGPHGFDAHPHDAAVCFYKAMCNLFGWASPQTMRSFFGERPPRFLTVKTGPGKDEQVQIPTGNFKLPGVDSVIQTSMGYQFMVAAELKKKEQGILLSLIAETQRLLETESIYLGKAIRIHVDADGDLDYGTPPEFMDVSDVSLASVVFDDDVMAVIEDNILVPIQYTEECVEVGNPINRKVLLEGPYGTGKSLLARVVAKICQDSGWTFVLLDRVQGLQAGLDFAKRYQGKKGAALFAEDIDRITEERDDAANDLINMVDGVLSKNTRIMTILTTNHVEKIQQVMLRPGRQDVIISLRAPGPKAAERIMRLYGGSLISAKTSLVRAGKAMAGQIPATFDELIRRAKYGMVKRVAKGGERVLSEDDILSAAKTMQFHLDLLKDKSPPKTEGDKLFESLQAAVGNGKDKEVLMEIKGTVNDIYDHVT